MELLENKMITKQQRNYIDEWFDNFAQVFVAVSDIHMIDRDGQIRYSYVPYEGYVDKERLKACTQEAADRPDRETWLGIGRPLCREAGEDVVTMVRAVNAQGEGSTGGAEGILVIELNPDIFSGLLLNNHSMFPNQYTLIVDRNGDIISTNKKVGHTWLDEIEDRFGQGIRKFELRWEGKDYYVCGQYNGVTGWKTFSIVSLNDFFPQASELQRAVFTMVAVAVLLAAVVILLISYTFTRPIGKLMTAMKEIEKGDFKIQVVNKSRDEIGRLTESFNFMVSKIDHLVKEVYQEKIAQKNAELEALQAQINPHFLYNTLESINWRAKALKDQQISSMVESLGTLLRATLSSKKPLVTLDYEIGLAGSYMTIQKIRFEDRLLFHVECPEELGKALILPLPESGEYVLIVEVSNEGSVFEEGLLEKLLDGTRNAHGFGIGLVNIHQRIQMLFGEAYGLSFKNENEKAIAIITIPYKTEEDDYA